MSCYVLGLKQLAEQYPRYGYPTLHDMLNLEGLVVNAKRTYRVLQGRRAPGAYKAPQEAAMASDTDAGA